MDTDGKKQTVSSTITTEDMDNSMKTDGVPPSGPLFLQRRQTTTMITMETKTAAAVTTRGQVTSMFHLMRQDERLSEFRYCWSKAGPDGLWILLDQLEELFHTYSILPTDQY